MLKLLNGCHWPMKNLFRYNIISLLKNDVVNGVHMKFLLLLICFVLYGCSSISVNSNANVYVKNKIENNIRRGTVDRYSNDEIWKLGAAQVGYVESSYCQIDLRDTKPNNEALISALEVKTQRLGGNALVFDACLVNRSTANCHSYIQCRGMAYLVTY